MNRAILSSLAASLPAVWATAALPEPLVVSSDLTFTSRYVFRGVKAAGNSFQPTVEAGIGDFYAGIWANLPTAPEGTEINYYAGTGIALPNIDFASLNLGLTVYHYPRAGENRTHEFFAGANFVVPPFPAVTSGLYYFYDVDLRSHVVEATGTYSLTLEKLRLPASLDLSLLGGVQSGSRAESYHYYGAALELPFALNEHSEVKAGVHWETAERIDFEPGQRGKNTFWTVSYASSF